MSMSHAAQPAATESAALAPLRAYGFPKRSKGQRRQIHHAPALLRPALFEAFDRAQSITTIDASGRVPVLVYQPSLATVVSLLGVLNALQIVVVLLMVARVVGHVNVFATARLVLGTELARVAGESCAGALIYSGAFSCPTIVRVGRPVSS